MKCNVTNREALNAAIDTVQTTRHSARTITQADIVRSISKIEARLESLLAKKDWVGLNFKCDPNAQNFPGAYKGVPESTAFVVERFPSGWFVTSVFRSRCSRAGHDISALNLNERAHAIGEFVSQNF